MDGNVNVKVAVRCRPLSKKEISRDCKEIVVIEPKTVHLKSIDAQHEDKDFAFDFCYGSDSTQQQVYQDLGRPIVEQALDGFNGTIFAYGQTGSGKSFSMMGSDDTKGIIPQLNEDLFDRINRKIEMLEQQQRDAQHANATAVATSDTKYMITVSFLEVYNEEIKDLLNPSDKKLKIHENPKMGIYVDGLCELIVRDSSDLMRLIYQGNAVRRVASTMMNDQSSRSHSVFTIKIEQKTSSDILDGTTGSAVAGKMRREQIVKAKVNLVDLAGSERAAKTGATGSTLKEGANINLSLMALGNVINMLSEGAGRKGGKKVIPYRESKLTRLLQESLGGNAATVMIAAISPADYNYAETLSTLKYAHRAKSIENAVTRNEDNNEKMIRDLQKQIEDLKKQLMQDHGNNANVSVVNSSELEQKLKEMEASQLNAWEEKERLSRALEAQRQANMSNVISEMMHSVKEEKVMHMKNIKRLTNEKAMVSKNFKEFKEQNVRLKSELDDSIKRYQILQKEYDDLSALQQEPLPAGSDPAIVEKRQAEAEEMAGKMITLLTKIENDRLQYTEKRDALKRMRARLDAIDAEITDERAELVATAGLLSQNDELREKIQQEEREKMKVEFEAEIMKAKQKLDEERQNVRETISSELEQEMERLRSEIKLTKSLLQAEEAKNAELKKRHDEVEKYSDLLEARLADSEVALEVEKTENEQLRKELALKEEELKEREKQFQLEREKQLLEQKERNELLESYKNDAMKTVEDAKYEMFQQLMDAFEKERQLLEREHKKTQHLLSQAAKDVLYLSQENQRLSVALNQAIYNEPPCR